MKEEKNNGKPASLVGRLVMGALNSSGGKNEC